MQNTNKEWFALQQEKERDMQGERIRDLRAQFLHQNGKMYSQSEMARQLGMPVSNYSEIENGQRELSKANARNLRKLCKEKLNRDISYEYLFGESNAMDVAYAKIQEETGLSDAAIKSLHQLDNLYNDVFIGETGGLVTRENMRILSAMLEHPRWPEVLYRLQMAKPLYLDLSETEQQQLPDLNHLKISVSKDSVASPVVLAGQQVMSINLAEEEDLCYAQDAYAIEIWKISELLKTILHDTIERYHKDKKKPKAYLLGTLDDIAGELAYEGLEDLIQTYDIPALERIEAELEEILNRPPEKSDGMFEIIAEDGTIERLYLRGTLPESEEAKLLERLTPMEDGSFIDPSTGEKVTIADDPVLGTTQEHREMALAESNELLQELEGEE